MMEICKYLHEDLTRKYVTKKLASNSRMYPEFLYIMQGNFGDI